MKLRRVMLAAPKSGSGKTLLTCALLQALKEGGYPVSACKSGPDYIDPMFHKMVLNVPSKNLDTFFTGPEETRNLLLKGRSEDEFIVMEGVMGLFDGLGGIREEGSSYHLATVTKTPVILVVDAKGMGRSLLPLIAGFLSYDREHLIRGVILNRMSAGYYGTLKPLLEAELKIPVLGYFPEQNKLHMESRHLGLKMPEEIKDLQQMVHLAAEQLKKTVSLEKIVQIAGEADELESSRSELSECQSMKVMTDEQEQIRREAKNHLDAPVIAVARDEAFCFYYEDNLRLLEEYGARLVPFSPLHDDQLPVNCSGLLIGGGYPELYAKQLSENSSMRASVQEAIRCGIPTVAECGGFMYLHDALEGTDGAVYPMAGVIPGICRNVGKLMRFGYIELREQQSSFLPEGAVIRGHEFHYYDSTDNGGDCLATKPLTQKSYACVHQSALHWWGFPHLYYPSNPQFAMSFVKKTQKFETSECSEYCQ